MPRWHDVGVACVTGGCNGSPSAGLQSLTDLNGLTAADRRRLAPTIPIGIDVMDGSVVSAEAALALSTTILSCSTLVELVHNGRWLVIIRFEVTWPRCSREHKRFD